MRKPRTIMNRALCGFPAQFYAEIPHNFVRVSRMYKDLIKIYINNTEEIKTHSAHAVQHERRRGLFYGFYLNIFGGVTNDA
jgi:hypothetical protein